MNTYVTGATVKSIREGNAETRLQLRGHGILYAYCNQHGLMKQKR